MLVGSDKRFVFLYHDISDPDAPQHSEHYSTRTEEFQEQIEFLTKHFKMVSLDEIVSGDFNHKGPFASITFDDGFFSVREEAFPYLSAKGIPFAVFASSTAVRHNRLFYGTEHSSINRSYNNKVFLDEDDIKYLAGQGVTIGSHSSNHRVLSDCDEKELKEEILENKLYLENLLDKKVRHLALPFGKKEHYNNHVLTFSGSVGHDFIYSTNPVFFLPTRSNNSPRLVPRISISNQKRDGLLFLINRPLFKKIDI